MEDPAKLIESISVISLYFFNSDVTSSQFCHWLRDKKETKAAYDFVSKEIQFAQPVDKSSLNIFIYKVFELFNKLDLNACQIHLKKQNCVIFDFVSAILKGKFLNYDTKNLELFQIIFAKLMLPFRHPTIFTQTVEGAYPEAASDVVADDTRLRAINFQRCKKAAYEPDFKDIWYLLDKKQRYNNHITILELHKSKKTTPKALFFCNFPYPFFTRDEDFIKQHNEFIAKTQVDLMDLIINFIKGKLEKIDADLVARKSELKTICDSIDVPVDNVFKWINDSQENLLRGTFEKARRKADRCENRPFVKRVESNSNNDSSELSILSVDSTEKHAPRSSSRKPDRNVHYSPTRSNNNRRDRDFDRSISRQGRGILKNVNDSIPYDRFEGNFYDEYASRSNGKRHNFGIRHDSDYSHYRENGKSYRPRYDMASNYNNSSGNFDRKNSRKARFQSSRERK
jgi:hypothetical protein